MENLYMGWEIEYYEWMQEIEENRHECMAYAFAESGNWG